MKFIVIGITDNPQPFFLPEVLEIIKSGKVFSGGKRHHEIVAPFLPANAQWIDITVPLNAVFEQYHDEVVVFASGDPLFFGFANTLQREFPDAELKVFPTFNSLQLLAHRLVMPYHDMHIVSLTGRPWQEFDRALIERVPKIGILTDKQHTPAAIAQRMLDYGYIYYNMYVGEHLGNPQLEKVTTLTLEEAAQLAFSTPNCVILDGKTDEHAKPYGIPDSAFMLLDGREKMITKMPIRLLTLQALDLSHRHVLWDIGACTGSVSIEARLQFPHLQVDLCCDSVATYSTPDAVFIGGHGGRLKDIMKKVLTVLAPNGIIVMNSVIAPKVLTDSQKLWNEACEELNLQQEPPLHIQLNDHHPITILKCKR